MATLTLLRAQYDQEGVPFGHALAYGEGVILNVRPLIMKPQGLSSRPQNNEKNNPFLNQNLPKNNFT